MKHAWQIILALLIPVLINADENDVFIIGDNFCLTNGTSAIFFDTPQDKFSEESITYPVPPNSMFNCKFEKEESTCDTDWFKNAWHIEDSFRTRDLEIIKDRRWESFSTIKTVITMDQKKYYYHHAADIDDNMTIPISVKAEQEAHIFLCDTSTPEVSTCYWITLGGLSGTVSTIKKCLPNDIPIALKTYSTNSCKINLVRKKENILDKKKWVHFFIQKFENLLKIFVVGDNGTTLFMDLDDPLWIIPKKLFVNNQHYKETALWKIHKYYYLASTQPDNTKELFLSMPIFSSPLCVSMFIKTGVNSSLDIEIRPIFRNEVTIANNFSTNGKWKYFKMYVDTDPRFPYTFYVRKKASDMKGFWAMDEIRECSRTEYRYLRAEGDSLNCQKLEEPGTLQISKKMDTVNADLPCSTKAFGSACVPCEIFGTESCRSFKYCERHFDGQSCYRTAGYYNSKCEVANLISDLQTYDQSFDSIYLRWRPPYPPTGILEKYKISYSGFKNQNDSKEVNIESCTFWKGYHCATITENILYKTYIIQVSAKNENCDYGQNSNPINVTTAEKGPTKVYNLDYSWTETNDLNIFFYHPNNTNGPYLKFLVLINDVPRKTHDAYRHYMPIYFYQVPWTLYSCTNINVCILGLNIFRPGGRQCISAKTPPGFPPDIKQINYSSTNTTITLNIEIEKKLVTMQKCYIFISYANQKCDPEEIKNSILQNHKSNLNFSRLVYSSSYVNSSFDFVIGTNDKNINPSLDPGTNYNLLVILSNTCNDMTRLNIGQKYATTMENMLPVITTAEPTGPTDHFIDDTTDVNGLWALLLLLIIPGFIVWYVCKKRRRVTQPIFSLEEQLALTDTSNIDPNVRVIKPKRSIIIESQNTKHSMNLKNKQFELYVKNSVTNGELKRQYDLFPRGLVKPHNVGSSADNQVKNCSKDLIAYDHTRVKLKRPPGDDQNDYINANYIDGYKKPRAYIATQGPKANTVTDFWMMIWQDNVCNIIMLANLCENKKKKVEKYWPDINEDNEYGDFKIHFESSSVYANYEERTFLISHKNEKRTIKQLHFTTWLDQEAPLYFQSLVPFLQKMSKIPYNPLSPIVVHCSTGVGRTGTIILSDIILRMAAAENSIDFLAYFELILEQRANLIDTFEQYKLAHLVVLECLFGMRTAIVCNDNMRTTVENIIRNDGIKTQMNYILRTQWQDYAMETILLYEEISVIYEEKNRFQNIVPEKCRVTISKYPQDDFSSAYINAIFVNDFRNPERFIVTQQPMPNTIGDFWRMVLERSCRVIISLNTIDLQDETVCQIWPEKNEELNPADFIKIAHTKTTILEFYKTITVELTEQFNGGKSFSVDIIALDKWRYEDLLPNSLEGFLTFRESAEAISRTSESVVVMCYDGAKASGLYVALSFIIEKMKLEQECDVCLAVRALRQSRKQFVTTEKQYEFLYRASLAYLTGFQPYSNFA